MINTLLEVRTIISCVTVIAILVAYKKIQFKGIMLNAIAESEVLFTSILLKSGIIVHDGVLFSILSTFGAFIKMIGYMCILIAFIELRDPTCWVLEWIRKLKKSLMDLVESGMLSEGLYDPNLR